MRIFLTIGIAAILIGCNTSKELNDNLNDAPQEENSLEELTAVNDQINDTIADAGVKPQRPVYVRGEIGELSTRTNSYQIESAKIEGNILYLTVTYPGGCDAHKFRCIGSPAIAKSNPPRRSIKLIHNANNESCESLVTRNIEVDIIPFAASAEGPSEIILDLEGLSHPLKFNHK